jgi:hypothetical protein
MWAEAAQLFAAIVQKYPENEVAASAAADIAMLKKKLNVK